MDELFTIVDVTTGESVKDGEWPFDNCDLGCRQVSCTHGEPALFDTKAEAEAFAVKYGYADNEHRIQEV